MAGPATKHMTLCRPPSWIKGVKKGTENAGGIEKCCNPAYVNACNITIVLFANLLSRR